jgi:Domain of unknown function (DUF4062)
MRIFVSSTRRDLQAHRNEVALRLREMGHDPVLVEELGADPVSAAPLCDDYIATCDVFVGMYAFEYGFVLPDGMGITEREFHLARELGLRCLCFLAEEASPGGSAAGSQDGAAKLEAFKQELASVLVLGRFRGPQEVAGKVATAVHKLDAGRPLGIVPTDVRERWSDWQRDRYATLRERGLRDAAGGVASPLTPFGEHLIGGQPWHERVAALRDQVVERLDRRRASGPTLDRRLGSVQGALRAIDMNGRYARIADALLEAIDEDVMARVDAVATRARDTVAWNEARELAGDVRRLRDAAKSPRYACCLPVVGKPGAGKTHFVGALLAGHAPWSATTLVVPLDPPPSGGDPSLEILIRTQVDRASGVRWRSIDELDQFVTDNGWRLLVVIDDLHLWLRRHPGLSDDLMRLIADCTRLHSIRWLIAIDETHLDDLSGSDQGFWRRYGYIDRTESASLVELGVSGSEARMRLAASSVGLGGWLRLDELNRSEQVGWRIYAAACERPPTLPDATMRRQLASPDVAWMAIDLRQRLELGDLLSLDYVALVHTFWQHRQQYAPTGGLSRRALDEAARLVAEPLLEAAGQPPAQTRLVAELCRRAPEGSELAEAGQATAALDALRSIGVLSYSERELPLGLETLVEREFDPFWHWRMGQGLAALEAVRAEQPDDARLALESWCDSAGSGEIAEPVMQFLLLVVDASGTRNFTRRLLEATLSSAVLPAAAAWLAGPQATPVTQAELGSQAFARKAAPDSRRELFAQLYFLAEAAHAYDRPDWRFRPLCQHLEEVRRQGFEEYLGNACARWLVATPGPDLPRAMRELHGLEGADGSVADRMSAVARDAMLAASSGQLGQCLAWMLDYARREQTRSWRGPRDPLGKTFREWVLLRFCEVVFLTRGTAGFRWLRDNGWYGGRDQGIDRHVVGSMRVAADLAFGFWYRARASTTERRQYEQLVDRLSRSAAHRDHQRAYYLIRHSVSTRGRRAPVVNRAFCPILDRLTAIPGATRHLRGLEELHRVNCR